MKKDCRLRTRFGSVVTAGLVTSALLAAPVTVLVGAVPAMAETETEAASELSDIVGTVQYSGGERESITLGGLRSLKSGNANIIITNNIKISDGDNQLIIQGTSGSVDLDLNGHTIENTFEGNDYGTDLGKRHAIMTTCNLTIHDGAFDPLDQKSWNPEKTGRVYSQYGDAVQAGRGASLTIDGGYFRSDSSLPWSSLIWTEKVIDVKRGAFDRNLAGDGHSNIKNKYYAYVTSEGSDGKTDGYWLVGDYVRDALGDESRHISEVDTSNNVVEIHQMENNESGINHFKVKDLINSTNYTLTIGHDATCGDAEVPEGTTLSPGGHLSKVVALSDPSTAKVEIEDQTWNDGRPITPHATVTVGDTTLSPSTDYYLDNFENNTQVGTAKVKVVGKGEYAGASLDATFNIVEPVATPEEDLKAATANMGVLLNDMDRRRYTDDSVQAVQDALDEANQVLADFNAGKATKDDVEVALTKLNDAYGKLSYKAGISMHRLYNPNSGEHFYTASTDERDHLVGVGWRYEGTGWTAPASSNTAVYRLYNPNAGDHHYTTSEAERDALIKAGWNYEGIGWFSDDAREVPLLRQYNPNAQAGSHNFTTSRTENDHLVSLGWRAEGIGWYGMRTAD